MKYLSPWSNQASALTRKKRQEKNLSHSLEWDDQPFRKFFEKSPIPMCIDDIHHRHKLGLCLQVNEAFKKLFGYSLKETRNLNDWFRQAFPMPTERKKTIRDWLRDIRRARRHGGVMRVTQDRIRTKNGKEVIVEVGGVVLGDYLLSTFVDRTQRVKAEEDLARSESLFRMIFENLPTPAAHVDFGRKDYGNNPVFLMNQSVHRVFGYSKRDLPNVVAWMNKAYPDPKYRKEMHDKFFGQIARLKKTGDIMKPMEFRMRCKDGSEKNMLWTGFKMPRGFLALSTDLTEVRQAQGELAESEKKFRQFFEQLPLPAVHVEFGKTHEKNRFLGMNRAFHKMYGYSAKELRTLDDWLKRAYPDPKYRKQANEIWFRAVERAVKTGDFIQPHDYRMRCKDGRELIVATTGVLFDKSMLVVGLDRTDLRKAEANLKKQTEEESLRLQQKLQTSVVASAVAHEVNQPLSEILIKSQIALQRADQLAGFCPQVRNILAGIVEDSRRVEKTIERMRALLRNVPVQLVPVDLREVAQSSLLYLKRALVEAGIRLETSLPNRPAIILGDASQLQLAIANLLRNSIQAIQENRASVRKIRLDVLCQKTHAEITVMDSGPGLAPDVQNRIFSLLTSRRPRGTGLGLYLVRTTVVNHRGEVIVEKSPWGGAGFRIRIPLQNAQKEKGQK